MNWTNWVIDGSFIGIGACLLGALVTLRGSLANLRASWYVNLPKTRDCCDELIHAAMNVESNVIADGFTIQCAECLTWWRFIQGGAVWWERTDTNERRAVELREEMTILRCGVRNVGHGAQREECNLPANHYGPHQQVSAAGHVIWENEYKL